MECSFHATFLFSDQNVLLSVEMSKVDVRVGTSYTLDGTGILAGNPVLLQEQCQVNGLGLLLQHDILGIVDS
jgi:hypothetical protein